MSRDKQRHPKQLHPPSTQNIQSIRDRDPSVKSELENAQPRKKMDEPTTVVSSLKAELEVRTKQVQSLTAELSRVSAHCQSLEVQLLNVKVPSGDLVLAHDQLQDALVKNQQWVIYDQQRETYLQAVVMHVLELKQRLSLAEQNNQVANSDGEKSSTTPEGPGEGAQPNSQTEQLQKELENQKDQVTRGQQDLDMQREQTAKAQADLQSKRKQVTKLREEMLGLQRSYKDKSSQLSALTVQYEDQSKELDEVKKQLQAERHGNRNNSCRHVESKVDLDSGELMSKEAKRSAKRQQQMQNQDFEVEPIDRQSMRHQLHKVQKQLHDARERISQLESAKTPNARFSEPSSYNNFKFERLYIEDLDSQTNSTNLLDESFLECPKCQASYPTSRHRELLMHMDHCLL